MKRLILLFVFCSFFFRIWTQGGVGDRAFVEKVKVRGVDASRVYFYAYLTKVQDSTNLFLLETRKRNGDTHSVCLKSYEKRINIDELEELRDDGLIVFEGESRKKTGDVLEVGRYKNNLPVDTFKLFNDNGSLIQTKYYSYGRDTSVFVELCKYHNSTNVLVLKSLRKSGELHGAQEIYSSGGILLERVNYDCGEIDGEWITYFKSGNINCVEQYKNGEFISSEAFDENGNKFKPRVRLQTPHYKGGIAKLQAILDYKMAPAAHTMLRSVEFTFSVDVDGKVAVEDVVPNTSMNVLDSDVDKIKQLVHEMPPMLPCIHNDIKVPAFFTYKHYYRNDIDTAKFQEVAYWIERSGSNYIKNFRYSFKEKPKTKSLSGGKMPRFPGGDRGLYEYLMNTIEFPRVAQQNKIYGIVIVEFEVSKVGEIKNAKILKGVHPVLETEAMRAVKEMPNWEPGTLQDGKPVDVSYRLPISFMNKSK